MKAKRILIAAITTVFSLTGNAQRMAPTATYLDENNSFVDSSVDFTEQAPLDVTFRANPENIDDHTAAFEWHFRKEGDTQDLMVRYEEDTQYTFVESGTFVVTLKGRLTDIDYEMDSVTIKITISESKLEFPNAFSPNDDKINDIYGAKGVNDPNSPSHYKNIVQFHAYIFNRWGQKIFEWTDVSKGWDGKHNGNPVKEGVYYVLVKAKGSDGREYNIRKDVNLLRGYTEGEKTGGNEQ